MNPRSRFHAMQNFRRYRKHLHSYIRLWRAALRRHDYASATSHAEIAREAARLAAHWLRLWKE